MVRAPETFLNTVLWPEFQQINAALSDFLAEVTDKVIREAVCKDAGDADDVPEPTRCRSRRGSGSERSKGAQR